MPATRRFVEFLSPELDQPANEGERRCYLICGAPRVGSELLCDLLRQSGVMGVPAEYFNTVFGLKQLAERFGVARGGKFAIDDYVVAIKRHRTTPNGVFGAKLQYWHLKPLLPLRVISRHLPVARFVYLSRKDFLAQGVSWAIAQQTKQFGRFRGEPGAPVAPVYDETKVLQAIDFVQAEERMWRRFFALNGIDVLEFDYETLCARTDETCKAVCSHVGVTIESTFSTARSRLAVQRNDVNADWLHRIKQTARY